MLTLLLLTCFPSQIEPAPDHETHTAELPRSPLFIFATRRDVPELDRLFTRKRQPESMSVDLVVPAQKRQSLVSGAILVQKGSMSVATDGGYLKFLPKRKVVAKAEGKREKEFELEHTPCFWLAFWRKRTPGSQGELGAQLSLGNVSDTPIVDEATEALAKMQQEGYLLQKLPVGADDQRSVVRLTVKFSPDFEGQVGDWHVRPIGKSEAALDGRDLWPALAEGRSSPDREILHNLTPTGGAIRVGDWKLVVSEGGRGRKKGRLRTVDLFNIAEDPYETTNQAAEQSQKARELRARLDAYAKAAVPPKGRPGGAPDDYEAPKVWGAGQ